MPELFIELFSEEIPASMQAGAAGELARAVSGALASLSPRATETFHGPRRIALRTDVASAVPAASSVERGPRCTAPEQALAGFLRKHNAAREDLREEAGYWVVQKSAPALPAARLIAREFPKLLWRFPWPKSMRWGGSSAFTWARPLRRILCLLDGEVVRFDLRDGEDDAHDLASGDLTEGHRFHAPGAFRVGSCAEWRDQLAARRVLTDSTERRRRIEAGLAAQAAQRDLVLVEDAGLLNEVAGLVEWPVPLLGRIDPGFMDLPAEVMQVSMRVNQRYFALRQASGAPAPWFGFVANIEAEDGGATIIAGNERVLRARFADARHFWDLDRRTKLADRVPTLDGVTFHAKLGSQGERVARLRALARRIAPMVGADPGEADRAALLAKADLVSGMVGEFPELQGAMGRYYALHDGEPSAVAEAIREHYAPKGPADVVPSAPVSVAVALADKMDQLAAFFAIGERPTGSGDPYALRRAALGVVRVIRENDLRINLSSIARSAVRGLPSSVRDSATNNRGPGLDVAADVVEFIIERLRVQLRADGARHDVLAAVFAAGADDDIVRLLSRAGAVTDLLGTEDGANLLVAHRRAANILRIEDRKDGPHEGAPDPALFSQDEERALAAALEAVSTALAADLAAERFGVAMTGLARLRAPIDAFFERVTVNAPDPATRRNRLRLLRQIQVTMNQVADWSQIEG